MTQHKQFRLFSPPLVLAIATAIALQLAGYRFAGRAGMNMISTLLCAACFFGTGERHFRTAIDSLFPAGRFFYIPILANAALVFPGYFAVGLWGGVTAMAALGILLPLGVVALRFVRRRPTAASIGAGCLFLLMSLAAVARAQQNPDTPPAKPAVYPVRRTYSHAKTPAEHNAEMFRGTPQALDQLGTFPDSAQPVKKSSGKLAQPLHAKTRKTTTPHLRAQSDPRTPAEHNAEMFRGTPQALHQLGTFPDIPPQPAKSNSGKSGHVQPNKTQPNPVQPTKKEQ